LHNIRDLTPRESGIDRVVFTHCRWKPPWIVPVARIQIFIVEPAAAKRVIFGPVTM